MAALSMNVECGHRERIGLGLVALVALLIAAPASAEPRTHKVYAGQRLGSIAKRYNVSVDAIAHANDIDDPSKIKPGRVLMIPDRDDDGGEQARKLLEKKQKRSAKTSKKAAHKTPKKSARGTRPKLHRVYRGQTLGAIARRYRVSITALCHANEITRRTPLKVGQQLIVPTPGDKDGTKARSMKARLLREQKQSKALELRVDKKSWRKYARPPRRKGYVTLQGHHGRWKGYVIGPRGQLLPKARHGFADVLDWADTGPGIDRRLIRLLTKVSDRFGGRPLRVVSGFRKASYVDDSRHKYGRAVDFHIPGVPNEALRDYLLSFDDVGVGYYPNSTFVHFDVRPQKTYWVDLAGPGQPPRYAKVLHLK